MELISVHIPKTAGVSFRNLLQGVYGQAGVLFDYGDRLLDPGALCHVDPAEWARTQRDPLIARAAGDVAVKVIHGHFAAGKYARSFLEARRIVWVREPVARVVSHYHYWRGLSHAGHGLHRRLLEENLSLEEFAALEPMRDAMSRLFLSGMRLEDFDFVGLQEHFDADLTDLARLLGWPASAVPERAAVENRGEKSASALTSLDERTRQRLLELNPADTVMYQHAAGLRASRLGDSEPRRKSSE